MNQVPMCAVVHFEMPYQDRDRAARVYEAAFGWQTEKLGPEMGHYLLVTTALPGENPGCRRGGARRDQWRHVSLSGRIGQVSIRQW